MIKLFKRHKHEWKLTQREISVNCAWVIKHFKCKCGKVKVCDRDETVWLKHYPIPNHKHTVSNLWNGTDYPTPLATAYCENCGRVCRLRLNIGTEKSTTGHACPGCETGAFVSQVYYAPCCVTAMNKKRKKSYSWKD